MALGISVNKVEKDMGLTRHTLVVKGRLSEKHKKALKEHLRRKYSYDDYKDGFVEMIEDRKMFNVGRPYDMEDGIIRVVNDNGLFVVVPEDMIKNNTKGYGIKSGEELKDWRGYFVLLNNGLKGYIRAYDDVLEDKKENGKFYYKFKHYVGIDR